MGDTKVAATVLKGSIIATFRATNSGGFEQRQCGDNLAAIRLRMGKSEGGKGGKGKMMSTSLSQINQSLR
jgi:hypothetical protein